LEKGQPIVPPVERLPPPGEAFNALHVVIKGVTISTEPGSGEADVFCTCEVRGDVGHLRTEVAMESGLPQWRFESDAFAVGKSYTLRFCAYEQDDNMIERLLGKTWLRGPDIAAKGGYSGELLLTLENWCAGAVQSAVITVSVEPYMAEHGPGTPTSVMRKVDLTFWKSMVEKNEDIVLTFTYLPLGLHFEKLLIPLTVSKEPQEGQAKELGVKRGWILAKLDGIDLTTGYYTQVIQLFEQRLKELPFR